MADLTDLVVDGKRITLLQLMDIIETENDNIPESGVNVTLFPPVNATDDLTDEDSATEDNPSGDNFPASQLEADAMVTDVNIIRVAECHADDSQPQINNSKSCSVTKTFPTKNKTLHSNKRDKKKCALNRKNQYDWKSEDLTSDDIEWLPKHSVLSQTVKSPLEYFQLFFDEEVINMMVVYTNQYAAKKNRLGDCTETEMLVFIGILLLSGYVSVPRRKMYWQTEEDTRNELVAQAMSRDRFDFIMSNLHVCDNDSLDHADRFAKIRKIVCMMNQRFSDFSPHERFHSIDESMVPYFGSHGCKQFIKGKPIRYGYKFWCGGTSNGYIIWVEPYQGAGTCSPSYKDKGMGYGVVMTYSDQLLPNIPYHFFFDNLFTSQELLLDLKSRGLDATGTIRGNRVDKACNFTPVEEFKKTPRGSFEIQSDNSKNISLVRWNDNSVVTIATNNAKLYPLHSISRFSREQRKNIKIPQPHLINLYNKHMGGIDRADENVSLYRISIRGKKWYFCLIAQMIDLAEQNAWYLYKKDGGNLDHLAFRRRIATAILQGNKKVTSSKGRPSKTAKCDSRYDGKQHYVADLPYDSRAGRKKQLKCRVCHKKASTKCVKCDVTLHVTCFQFYHV